MSEPYLNRCYKALGLEPNDSFDRVESRYRELQMFLGGTSGLSSNMAKFITAIVGLTDQAYQPISDANPPAPQLQPPPQPQPAPQPQPQPQPTPQPPAGFGKIIAGIAALIFIVCVINYHPAPQPEPTPEPSPATETGADTGATTGSTSIPTPQPQPEPPPRREPPIELQPTSQPSPAPNNESTITDLREQLRAVNTGLDNINADKSSTDSQIAEAGNSIDYFNTQASNIQSSLGVDFINNAAAKRWHPMEFAQWEAYLQQAYQAKKTIEKLKSKRDYDVIRNSRQQQLEQQRADIQNKLQALGAL